MQVSTSFLPPDIQQALKRNFRTELRTGVFDLDRLISSFSSYASRCDCTADVFYGKYKSWIVVKGVAPLLVLEELKKENEPQRKETIRPVSDEETKKIREQLLSLTTTQG